MSVTLALLGELRLRVDGVEVPRLSPKARALVACLALRRDEIVSVDWLNEELWPELDTERAKRVVQVRVAEIRKLLSIGAAGSCLESAATGYRFRLDAGALDSERFLALMDDARRCAANDDPLGTASTLRQALGLWRGPALVDAQTSAFLEMEGARLDELRVSAIEERVSAELADGCHQRLIPELRSLVDRFPLRERLWTHLAVALYRCGRQVDALHACACGRQALADGLGIEPAPILRDTETALLAHDPSLAWVPRSASARTILADPFAGPDDRVRAEIEPPPVRYVKTVDGVSLAYQVFGDGPTDLVIVPGYISELDNWWEAWSGRLVRRMASFARVILFDKRGLGLSDRPERIAIDDWVDDVRTVLDAVGSARPAMLGMSAGSAVAVLFSAIHPERTGPLVIYAGSPRVLADDAGYRGRTEEELEQIIETLERDWGTGESLARWCPSVGGDPAMRAQFGQFERRSASPGSASSYIRMLASIDVRSVLPLITTPTHVIHPRGDRSIPVEVGRYVAEQIPGATLCELDTSDHLIWFSERIDEICDEVERFVTTAQPAELTGHRLLTVVAVLVDCLDQTVLMRWRELTASHGGHAAMSGEHLLARFTRPSCALRFAHALVANLSSLGSPPRVGVHCGYVIPTECEPAGSVGDEARRLAATAAPGHVRSSTIVHDLAGTSAVDRSWVGALGS